MIGALIFVAVAIYFGVCLLTGFGPAPALERFEADGAAFERRFANPARSAIGAYTKAVRQTPGMRLAETSGNVLLVDLRPTTRVMSGNFGLVMRFEFHEREHELDGGKHGCGVTAQAMNKVPFSFLSNHHAAFVHAERALRMTAKRIGLRELVPGIN